MNVGVSTRQAPLMFGVTYVLEKQLADCRILISVLAGLLYRRWGIQLRELCSDDEGSAAGAESEGHQR